MELWKQIEETNYAISTKGRVKNVRSGVFPKTRTDRYGYEVISLYNTSKKKKKYYTIHRLVALAFIENSDSLPQINHKDENKTNNAVDNLEWCSSRYNANYGTRSKRCAATKSRPIVGTDIATGERVYFNSAKEAGENGYNFSHVCSCVRGDRKKHKGKTWRLLNAE